MNNEENKSSEEELKQDKEKLLKGVLIWGGGGLFALLFFAGYWNILTGDKSYPFSNIAAVGDSFGIVTCIASIVTVFLVYFAWKTQREELRNTREELAKANDAYVVANKARDEANEAYKEQLRNNERNNFFNEFKELVKPLGDPIFKQGNTKEQYEAVFQLPRSKENMDKIDTYIRRNHGMQKTLYRFYVLLRMIRDNQSIFGGILKTNDVLKLYTYMNLEMNYFNYRFFSNLCSYGYFRQGGYVEESGARKAIEDWLNHNLVNESLSVINDE